MSNDKREGTFYLVVQEGRYWNELKVAKATNKKPSVTPEGSVVVKLKVTMPRAAFKPLEPSVVVDVPEDMLVTGNDVHLQAVADD
jgi:hypothetical protein